MNQAIQDFETQIVKKAIKQIDQDALAKKLAKVIEGKMSKEIEFALDDRARIGDWLMDELTNENTEAGKVFNKAIAQITKKMAKAITE